MEYNEEKEHKLLSKCKYFDGMPTPKETLKQNERMLWWYERKWLFESMRGSNFKQYIAEYKANYIQGAITKLHPVVCSSVI